MNRTFERMCLIAIAATGCSSDPPRLAPSETRIPGAVARAATAWDTRQYSAQQDSAARLHQHFANPARTPRETYEAVIRRPSAAARALYFYLESQTFEYIEDGQSLVSGPIASGKASSPTPTGSFSVLAKEQDKVSSLYKNEIGTQAWMPYSIQFHGNYFVHEGWLPGHPASHGCIRLEHHHAKLLFERMQIGDPVIVENR